MRRQGAAHKVTDQKKKGRGTTVGGVIVERRLWTVARLMETYVRTDRTRRGGGSENIPIKGLGKIGNESM